MTIGTVPVNSRYLHTGSEISKIHTMRYGHASRLNAIKGSFIQMTLPKDRF